MECRPGHGHQLLGSRGHGGPRAPCPAEAGQLLFLRSPPDPGTDLGVMLDTSGPPTLKRHSVSCGHPRTRTMSGQLHSFSAQPCALSSEKVQAPQSVLRVGTQGQALRASDAPQSGETAPSLPPSLSSSLHPSSLASFLVIPFGMRDLSSLTRD